MTQLTEARVWELAAQVAGQFDFDYDAGNWEAYVDVFLSSDDWETYDEDYVLNYLWAYTEGFSD